MAPCSATGTSPGAAALDPTLGDGPLLGKRYADDDLGLELLCTRAGTGALTVDGRPLLVKGPSPCRRRTDATRGMNLLLLLDMVAAGRGDETAVQAGDDRLTAAELLAAAWAGAGVVAASALAYVGTNGLAFPSGCSRPRRRACRSCR